MSLVAITIIIIGSLLVSIKNTVGYFSLNGLILHDRLSGIILGLGIGIIVVSIPRFIMTFGNKTASEIIDVNKSVTAVAIGLISLFTTVIGSWSWNLRSRCKTIKNNNGLSVVNVISTIIASLVCVLAFVYFGYHVRKGYKKATGTSATGTSATGTSATGTSATGTSATGTSAN
jgi:hypothetical protein